MIGIDRWATVTQLREDQAEVMDFVAHHDGVVAVSRHLQTVAVIMSPNAYLRIARLADEARRAPYPFGQCRCGQRTGADDAEW